ncbi:MAG: Inositol-phosphate phosphatase [Chloroflexi bacterium]|nr:Inositol-phosphate phosphatase [Chloroflexota bacterium]
MQRPSLESQLAVASDAARVAGELLRSSFGKTLHIRHKGEIDLVTEADEAAERLIVDEIQRHFPTDSVLAEEGTTGGDDGERLWIIDPLDGTTNFAHNYPVFSVSIALEVGGVMQIGVVYQPLLNEMFTAVRDRGAFLNGLPIHVSHINRLSDSLLCSGFPYEREVIAEAIKLWGPVLQVAEAVRRDGSAAIDLCYVAMGRFDGFWERGLKPWDIAAGSLVVREAGGRLSDYSSQPFDVRGCEIAASNGLIHDDLVAALHVGP